MLQTKLQKQLATANKAVEAAQNKANIIQAKITTQTKAQKPKILSQTLTTLPLVYKYLKADPKKDVLKIDNFDADDHSCLEHIIMRMRIRKAFSNGILPKQGNKRWAPWSWVKPTGLVFGSSGCSGVTARTGSAARLGFLTEEDSNNYAKNFMAVEEGIIQLTKKA